MLKPGWLNRQFEKVEKDVKDWPDWMKKEAGLDLKSSSKSVPKERGEMNLKEIEDRWQFDFMIDSDWQKITKMIDVRDDVDWLINRVKELETNLSLANSLLATQCDLAREAETTAMKAISDLEDFKILTNVWICAYCGQKFPKDAAMSPVAVADHAVHCEKSPLVQKVMELESELSRLKLEKIPLVEVEETQPWIVTEKQF